MGKQGKLKRREFLAKTGGMFAAPYFIPSGVLAAPGRKGANDRIVIGHIGMGGRQRGLYRELGPLREKGECVSVAVCDVDSERLAAGAVMVGAGTATYQDYRALLLRKDIDAVVASTPDHWHGVMTVHAAECGKHVYVEKPASCTIEESHAMVAAARRHGIAVQVGSQGRSQPEAYLAHRYLVNNLGRIDRVTCWHDPNPTGGETADSTPPSNLDWDFWLGPLRWRPYNSSLAPGKFRWMMESGGGRIRDRGAHVMSNAMYWMGADGTGPVTVEATGTAGPTTSVWDCPINMDVTYTFKNPDWVMTWNQPGKPVPPEERKAGEDPIKRPQYGAIYHGENEEMVVWGGDGGTWAERKVREWKPPAGAQDVYRSPGQMEDWFKGIRTGRKTIMNMDAAAGVSNLCILGNVAYTLGRKLTWDQAKGTVVGDEQAARLMSRPQRHPYHL
jgi:predicted dehydrogenase